MSFYKATITEIRQLTPSVKLFEIDLGGQTYDYLPGQWVQIALENGETNNAAFSITSIPNGKNAIEIAVKRVEYLPSSKLIHDQLQIGDELSVSHPQGDIVLPKQLQQPLVFIAGGTGITPFMSMLRQIYNANRDFNATLLYSVTSSDEGLFYDELYELQREYRNFRFVLTTTREAVHHAEFFGRISSEMLKRIGLDHKANFYLCGPPQMVDDVAGLLIDLSIPANQIHYDKWW